MYYICLTETTSIKYLNSFFQKMSKDVQLGRLNFPSHFFPQNSSVLPITVLRWHTKPIIPFCPMPNLWPLTTLDLDWSRVCLVPTTLKKMKKL